MSQEREALLILGNQLFPKALLPKLNPLVVFMAEDYSLCTHFRYHKHKIILFLASMREYASQLEENGAEVHYQRLSERNQAKSYEEKLEKFLRSTKADRLITFEIEDKFFEKRIIQCCEKNEVELTVLSNPMFMVSRDEFSVYLTKQKRPFMKSFYEKLRRDTGILMTKGGNPIGNKFSFDIDNRESLPRDSAPPELPEIQPTKHVNEVAKLCDKLFPDHPGDTQGFWLPTTRKQSLVWLNDFLENRLRNFGTYEDAISFRSDFVYHSALSPLLNLGLITPKEVISKALKYADANSVPLNSLEGLIRQILGWREFVRGIYQNYSEEQDSTNFWKHSAKLADCWYDATTGIPPVDDAIQKALRLGYNHHIERLMVLSNVMLLSEISPREVHRWFMEMYVDSSDWVMGPNVYGMGQFSDGGIFVTKPYICGSNYILKMSDYTKGDWCDTLDGLYWSFVDKHQAFFKKNPRTSAVMGNLNRMDPSRKERIFKAAKAFRAHATSS